MKTLFCKTGLLASFLSFLLNCNASPQEELLNLSRIDLLPQFRSDEKSRQITSFPMQYSEKEKLAQAVAIKAWSSYGKEVIDLIPSLKENVKNRTTTVLLKPGETTGIFEQNTGGRIVGIELIPQAELNRDFKDLILNAVWDEEPAAAINCPVSDFFGYAFGRPSMQSMIVGVKDRVHYCFFPMPYDKKASLKLAYLKTSGNSTREIPCKVKIYYTDSSRKENEGKFYVSWKREINPGINKPYTILEKRGRGNYVGTLLQAQGLNPGMTIFFEGDDICSIDGEMRLHGTGSEDSFNGGWYALPDRWDQAFSLPVHGALAYSIPLAHTGGYRLYVSDKLSFENNFNLAIEHGPENNLIPVDYTSVAFYYCDTPPAKNDLPPLALLSAIKLEDNPEGAAKGSFFLHRIFLEKI